MDKRPLTDLGIQLRDGLPPVLRESHDYLAICHALARELERAEGMIEQVRNQFDPQQADILLPAWEWIVKLPVGGAGATPAQRQQKIVARLRKLLGNSEGREWEAAVTELIGPGWSYEENIPGDGSTPAAGTLRITLPFPPSGSAYAEALAQIREVTPAHLDITFLSPGGTGFLLDESELDLEGLGV